MMLYLICIVLLAFIVVLQFKIIGNAKSAKNEKSEQNQDSENISDTNPEVAETARPAPHYEVVDTSKDSAFQRVFLGNIFNKIGALAIIVALIFFIKMVSTMVVFTPLFKFCSAFAFGLLIVLGGLKMHTTEKLKNYSEVLLGTGFASLYITTFCGYSLFKILTPVMAIAIGTLLLLATYAVADKMKTYSMIAIGLIGGYLTPFLSGADSTLILSFLIFLNMVSLAYSLKNKKIRFLNVVNLVLTMLIMVVYNFVNSVGVIYPIILWGVYILYDILRDKSSKLDTAVSFINYFVLTIFTMWLGAGNNNLLGILFAVSAIGYFLLAGLSRFSKNNLYKYYEHCVLINILLFSLFVLKDVHCTLLWSILALVLAFAISRYKTDYLKPAMILYYIVIVFGALITSIDGQWCLFAGYDPIWNLRTLIFGIPVLSMTGSSLLLCKEHKTTSNVLCFCGISLFYLYLLGEINSIITFASKVASSIVPDVAFARVMTVVILGFLYAIHTRAMYNRTKFMFSNVIGIIFALFTFLTLIACSYFYPDGYAVVLNLRFVAYMLGIFTMLIYARWTKTQVFKYLAVVLGFILVHSECVGVKFLFGADYIYVISLGWVLYSGLITTAGILRSKNYLKYCGIVLSILTVFRILIFDLPRVDAMYKLIICLVLGVIFMSISYLYTARKK